MAVFKQMIQLRDKVVESYGANVDALEWFKNGTRPVNDIVPVPVDGENIALHFQSNGYLTIDRDGEVLKDMIYTDLATMQEQIADDLPYTTVDLVNKLSESTTVYESISDLCTKYSYTNRVPLTDIFNQLDQVPSAEVQSFKNDLFMISTKDGYVTLPTFIKMADNYFGKAKEATDDEALEVDTTNPFTLQAVINVALFIISSALSAICTALSGVFGGFMLAIGAIIQLLTNMWSALNTQAEYEYDPTSGNTFVCGPVMMVDGFRRYCSPGWNSVVIPHNRHVYYKDRGGVAGFIWLNDDYSDYRTNCYLEAFYKPMEAFEFLINKGAFSLTGDGLGISNLSVNYSILRTLYDNDSIPNYDGDNSAPISKVEVIASLAMGLLIQEIICYGNTHDMSTPPSIGIQGFFNNTDPTISDGQDEKLTFRCAQLLIETHFFGGSTLEEQLKFIMDNGYDSKVAQCFTSWLAADVLSHGANFYCRATTWEGCSVLSTSIGSSSNWPMIYSFAPLHPMILSEASGPKCREQEYSGSLLSDCLPSTFGITLPKLNLGQVVQLLEVMAIIVIASAIAITPLRVKMAKRRYGKEALRADNINKKRTEYLNDPTNAAKRDAYESAALKFDLGGKWFGWGSFDAANGWVNSGPADSYTDSIKFNQMFSKQQSLNNDLSSLITQIRNLITTTV